MRTVAFRFRAVPRAPGAGLPDSPEAFGGQAEDEGGDGLVDGVAEEPLAGVVEAVDAALLVEGQQGLSVELLPERGDAAAEGTAEVGERAGLVEAAAGVEQEGRTGDPAPGAGEGDGQPAELGPRLDRGGEDRVLDAEGVAVGDQLVRPLLGLADLPTARVPARLLERGGDIGGEAGLGAYGGRGRGGRGGRVQDLLR